MIGAVMNKVIDLVARRRSADHVSSASLTHELERPRLERLVNEVRVAALNAPAGYGKTTLMRRWEQQWLRMGLDTAWIALDEEDRNPVRLFHRLREALHADERDGGAPLGAWQNRSAQDQCAGPARLRCARPCALLIDDAHRLRGSNAEKLLRHFVADRTDPLRIVIASRGPLELGQSKLKLSEHVLGLDADQLRFDLEELEALLPDAARAWSL
ncbi:MAG: AAA family ATPase, partial [Steroidobacteraceae bacterium]